MWKNTLPFPWSRIMLTLVSVLVLGASIIFYNNRMAQPETTPTLAVSPAPSPTFPPPPTPTPDLSVYLQVAGPMCDALFSNGALGADYNSIPSLILVKTVYGDHPSWRLANFQLPHQEYLNSANEFLLCILQDRIEKATYTDSNPGYQVIWDTRVFDESELVTSQVTLRGGFPPFIKSHDGPAYGPVPLMELGLLLDAHLSIETVFYGDSSILSLAYMVDGKIYAAGYNGSEVNLWDLRTGDKLGVFAQDLYDLRTAVFSPDGNILASGGQDSMIILWDTGTRQKLRTLSGHTGWIYTLAFSPDGKTLASGGNDGNVKLWNTTTGQEIGALSAQTLRDSSSVKGVAFSPDGRLLASGGVGGITIWEIATGQEVTRIDTQYVSALAFSPVGDTLASGTDTGVGYVELWEVATGQNLFTARTYSVSTLAFSPDGKTLAAGEFDIENFVFLRDVATWQVTRYLSGHIGKVVSLAFSPDGSTLASGSRDGSVRLWDLEEWR